MKIIITGGAGFIGSAVVRKAIELGHEVVNIDALTYAACEANLDSVKSNPRYLFEKADICNRLEIDRIFRENRPDMVMNIAAESHVDRSIQDPASFMETNIMGTFQLLEAALSYWSDAGKPGNFRFHHISTDEVFGSVDPDGKFDENSAYAPNSPYSASKASSNHLVRAWYETYGLPVIVTIVVG